MGRRQISVPAARLERWLGGFAERHADVVWTRDGDVVHGLGADGDQVWLDVPFPPLPAADDPVAALIAHVGRRRRIGVLLVRRGGHAVGIFDGDQLRVSKVGTSYVQGATAAGGWSQHRFARRRDNQAKAAFGAAADVAARILLPEITRLAAVIRGGDRAAVEQVLADARLAPLRGLVAGPLLAVPDPRLRVLQATPEQFLAVRITLDP